MVRPFFYIIVRCWGLKCWNCWNWGTLRLLGRSWLPWLLGLLLLVLPQPRLLSANPPNNDVLRVALSHQKLSPTDTLMVKIILTHPQYSSQNLRLASTDFENKGIIGNTRRITYSNQTLIQERHYEYALKPLKTGLGRLAVYLDEKLHSAYSVTVVAGKQRPLPPPAAHKSTPYAKSAKSAKSPPNFIVESTLSQNNLYINQPARYAVYLYQRAPIRHLAINTPAYEGISMVEREVPHNQKKVVTNGVTYIKHLLAESIIYPVKNGEFAIAAGALSIISQQAGFFARDIQTALTIPAVSLSTRPYPPAPAPATPFRNDYGDFTLTLTRHPPPHAQKASTGTPIRYTIRLTGHGNFKALLLPNLKAHIARHLPASLAKLSIRKGQIDEAFTFPPTSRKNNLFSGYKAVTYSVLAHAPIELALPPLKFTYFSHRFQTYRHTQAAFPPSTIQAPPAESPTPTQTPTLTSFALSPFTTTTAAASSSSSSSLARTEQEQSALWLPQTELIPMANMANMANITKLGPPSNLASLARLKHAIVSASTKNIIVFYHLLALSLALSLSGAYFFMRLRKTQRNNTLAADPSQFL